MEENVNKTLIYRGGIKTREFVTGDDPPAELSDISVPILAREYKGISNNTSTLVVEIWKLN